MGEEGDLVCLTMRLKVLVHPQGLTVNLTVKVGMSHCMVPFQVERSVVSIIYRHLQLWVCNFYLPLEEVAILAKSYTVDLRLFESMKPIFL